MSTRGYDAQNPRRVFISGQKRGVFGVIKRELRRRSAIEPIIEHLQPEGHLGRCYLKGRAGAAANHRSVVTSQLRESSKAMPPRGVVRPVPVGQFPHMPGADIQIGVEH
jgi:hypothetical protein